MHTYECLHQNIQTYIHFAFTERLFHVYDGFVFPHDNNWWNRINNYLLSTEIGTKESHGYALIIFLKMVNFSMSGFDTARAFEDVLNVYFHMRQKKYVHYTVPSRQADFCCVHQLNRGLHQVHTDEAFIYMPL